MRVSLIFLLPSYVITSNVLVHSYSFYSKIKMKHSDDRISSSSSLADNIKKAMKLSTNGQINITEAYKASSLWETILFNDDNNILSSSVKKLCYALYAASLVRIGRDNDALLIYTNILNMIDTIEPESLQHGNIPSDLSLWVDIKISKAEALQRKMKYQLARDEFNHVLSLLQCGHHHWAVNESYVDKELQCTYKAALCSLRLDDLKKAEDCLFQTFHYYQHRKEHNYHLSSFFDVIGMLGAVQIENCQRRNETIPTSAIDLLKICATTEVASPVYKWFYDVIRCDDKNVDCGEIFSTGQMSNLSSINNAPFDDPFLIYLDDKVFLHKMMLKYSDSTKFWPKGYILPNDESEFEKYCIENMHNEILKERKWIMKERSGYGSHGNQIVSAEKASEISSTLDPGHEVLCQQLVEPALCYQGKRFSLRIYVIYFQSHCSSTNSVVYVAKQGLIKLALGQEDDDENGIEDHIYMTNSGLVQPDNGSQYDFVFLKSFINGQYGPENFDLLWQKIESSVHKVMKGYMNIRSTEMMVPRHNTIFCSVPKIMGFDYLIDSSLNPWLIEVNRFPGLEARGHEDRVVKSEIVKNTWLLASKRCDEGNLKLDSLFTNIAL